MRRGTTPTLTFTLPFEADMITACNIAFAQAKKLVLEKELADCEVDGQTLRVTLTEEDTLRLNAGDSVEIQLRVGIGESRLASNIIRIHVFSILKDGVLE